MVMPILGRKFLTGRWGDGVMGGFDMDDTDGKIYYPMWVGATLVAHFLK